MYRQLVAVSPGKAELLEYTEKEVKSNEVRVLVQYASPKHGTELTDFTGNSPFLHKKFDTEWQLFLPQEPGEKSSIRFGEWNLGNQWVGSIVEKGCDVTDFDIGEIVCSYGGIRETHIVNAVDNYRLRKLNAKTSWKNALCYDPAQYALGAVRDANIRPGDSVAVFGLGAIGQIAVQICRKLGASLVVAVDPIGMRRDIALKNGAHEALNSSNIDVGLELKRLTNKSGVDAVIETSGHVSALQSALRGLAYGGIISYVAFAKEFNGLNFGREAHFNYPRIIFSRAGSEPNPDYPRWSRKRIEGVCWDMLTNGFLDCEDLINPIVPFSDCAEGFLKYVVQEPYRSIKMAVEF